MKTYISMIMAAAVATSISGCAPPAVEKTALIEDKIYVVTPDKITVKTGILLGEITEMTVVERVEQGTGRIDSAAKLKGKLKLTNSSTDQTVRLINGKILFIDAQGQPIKVDESRTEPTISFSSSYNSPDRLDPGKEFTQDIDVNFPAEALKTKQIKEIRLAIEYMPASYRKEIVSFNVTVNSQ